MVEYLTGVPRSGKSYLAMLRLVKTFGKDKEFTKKIPNQLLIKDVTQAYTNINEIKFKKFKNVKRLDFDDLFDKLTILFNHYKKDKYTDTQLKKVAKELNIYSTMFIIDECHNYLDKYDAVLIWWLTYHAHLHQHIILITQSLSLVYTKYKTCTEFFFKAVPSSLKLINNTMVYKKYTSSRLSKTAYVGKVKYKLYKEIFDYYGSGAKQSNKSVILPYIFISLGVLVFLFLFFKLVIFNYSDTQDIEDNEVVTQPKPVQARPVKNEVKQDVQKLNIENKKIFTIYCDRSDCYYKNVIFPVKFLTDKTLFDLKIIHKKIYSSNYVSYMILADSSFIHVLGVEKRSYILSTKGGKNETDNKYYSIDK